MNRKLHKEILSRDRECRLCGRIKSLHVHHITEIVEGKWLSAYVTEVPSLLVTLCSTCHGTLHGKGGGRKKWDMRRKLIQEVFHVTISPCERHTWIHPGEITYCRNCTMTKMAFDLSRITTRKVNELLPEKDRITGYPKSPIEKGD